MTFASFRAFLTSLDCLGFARLLLRRAIHIHRFNANGIAVAVVNNALRCAQTIDRIRQRSLTRRHLGKGIGQDFIRLRRYDFRRVLVGRTSRVFYRRHGLSMRHSFRCRRCEKHLFAFQIVTGKQTDG